MTSDPPIDQRSPPAGQIDVGHQLPGHQLPGHQLIAWYDQARRQLPWRSAPHIAANPYHVWLSEIMLQQTGVSTVIPYFNRFIARWPTVSTIAEARLDEILSEWAGLGYYARARNLHRCAMTLATQFEGAIPRELTALKSLPGVGPYTAAAIAAIAFDAPIIPVDGNIARITARYFAVTDPVTNIQRQFHPLAQQFYPRRRAGDVAQALMDLGSSICTVRAPQCQHCPIAPGCGARAANLSEDLPKRPPARTKATHFALAFWLTRNDGKILWHRRPQHGLLGGMLTLPTSPLSPTNLSDPWSSAPAPVAWNKIGGPIAHIFTHFSLKIQLYHGHLPAEITWKDPPGNQWFWQHPDDINAGHLPTLSRKLLERGRSVNRQQR